MRALSPPWASSTVTLLMSVVSGATLSPWVPAPKTQPPGVEVRGHLGLPALAAAWLLLRPGPCWENEQVPFSRAEEGHSRQCAALCIDEARLAWRQGRDAPWGAPIAFPDSFHL